MFCTSHLYKFGSIGTKESNYEARVSCVTYQKCYFQSQTSCTGKFNKQDSLARPIWGGRIKILIQNMGFPNQGIGEGKSQGDMPIRVAFHPLWHYAIRQNNSIYYQCRVDRCPQTKLLLTQIYGLQRFKLKSQTGQEGRKPRPQELTSSPFY